MEPEALANHNGETAVIPTARGSSGPDRGEGLRPVAAKRVGTAMLVFTTRMNATMVDPGSNVRVGRLLAIEQCQAASCGPTRHQERLIPRSSFPPSRRSDSVRCAAVPWPCARTRAVLDSMGILEVRQIRIPPAGFLTDMSEAFQEEGKVKRMDSTTAERLRRLAAHLDEHAATLIIDADTHATDVAALTGAVRERYEAAEGYYHGRPVPAEDLIREMGGAGIEMALIWQNPAATACSDSAEGNQAALLAANAYIRDAACRAPTRFIAAGWTDPKACGLERAIQVAETCVREFGFPIVKMNPAQNRYPIDSPDVLALVDCLVELGAVPAFHFGADTPYTPAEGLARVAARHPLHPLLAVHMGGGGAAYDAAESTYQAARALGLAQPNIRFILSAKRDTHIESDLVAYELAGEPFRRNLFCASDAPYGRMAWNFGGYRSMFQALSDGANHTDARVRNHPGLFTPAVAQNYMGGNFARFTAEACRRLLRVQTGMDGACR